MAELILTPEEKAEPKWLALDAETIGKAVLAGCGVFDKLRKDTEAMRGYSAIMLMIWDMLDAGGEEYNIDLKDVTCQGKLIGDFELTIKRK